MLKRVVRNGLCRVIFYTGVFHLARFLSDRTEKTGVILCFHRVVDGKIDFFSSSGTQVDLSRFMHQIRMFSNLFSIVPFSDLVDQIKTKTLGRASLALTFDDGFRDSYTNVFAVLKEYRIPALFFLSPIMIESSKLLWHNEPWYLLNHHQKMKIFHWAGRQWDLTARPQRDEVNALIRKSLFQSPQREREAILEKLRDELGSGSSSPDGRRLMLSEDEIAEMKKSGVIEMGSHAMTHASLSTCTEEELEYEIRQSKSDLEQVWKHAVLFFAYPFGRYSDSVVASLKISGYVAAVTLDEGLVKEDDDLLSLKRISIARDDTIYSILILKLFPLYLKIIFSRLTGRVYAHRES